MWTIVGARRAAGDRRRRRARHARARSARRSCSRWSRARWASRPNPLDGLTFFFEPMRPLAATIVENAEGLIGQAVRPDALRVRARCCSSRASFLSFAGWAGQAAAEAVRGACLMSRRRDRPPARRSRAVELVARPGAGATASASRCAGRPGSRCARSPAAIVVYMAVQGLQYLQPRRCSSATRSRDLDQSEVRRLPRPAHRHAAADVIGIAIATPIGVGDRGLARRVRPPGVARAGGRVGHRDRRRHAEHRARDLRAGALPAGGSSASCRSPPQGGAVFGRSFLTAGAMMSLIALPLVVGATREALQAIPRHVREASYALGKTTRRDDPPRAAAGRRGRTSPPARRSAWAASPATRRSS